MKKNRYPLVSVVIPVYNNVLWLEEAIESVMEQDYPDIEIIVINDGSTESFETFLEKYKEKIRYYYNENKGVAYARNFGIDNANGDYIAFLDSDDIWVKNKISAQVKYMKQQGIKWSHHNYAYFDNEDKKILKNVSTYPFRGNIIRYIFTSCLIQTSCVMVERAVLENNKEIRFDEKKRYGEDNAFYLKIARRYPLGHINQTLTYYRVRGENAGKNVSIQMKYRSTVYKECHNLSIYKDNTNFLTKLGYKYCYRIDKMFPNIVRRNGLGAKLIYIAPWIIFKINYFLLSCRRKKYE